MKKLVRRLGLGKRWRLDAAHDFPRDLDPEVIETIKRVKPFTQTSVERIAALCEASKYVAQHAIPGAIVECGVWRGGSTMAAALTLMRCADDQRELFLFDTYEGMSPPDDRDVALDGSRASDLLSQQSRDDPMSIWCYSSLDEVRENLHSTGYPADRLHFVKGKVEATLPSEAPEQIALLRLDTDWYESTRHELEHLFPRVVSGGVLIVDDYGHWEGARRAVDEYIQDRRVKILLNRIDYTGRLGIVP